MSNAVAQMRIDCGASYTRHKYVDWVTAGADFSGNEMEAAPRVLGNTRLTWSPRASVNAQLEWIRSTTTGSRRRTPAAFPQYGGHDLFNMRASWQATRSGRCSRRVIQRGRQTLRGQCADLVNTPVYSPGLPRTYYAGVEVRW